MHKQRVLDKILFVALAVLLLFDIFSDSPSLINYMNYIYLFCFAINVTIGLIKRIKTKSSRKDSSA